jgi:hypothetical protein
VHALCPTRESDGVGAEPKAWRNLTELQAAFAEFSESDAKEAEAKEFQNAVRPCLIATEIEGNIVPPPLHLVRCGIAGTLLDRIERYCKQFDDQVGKAKAARHAGRSPFMDGLKSAMDQHHVYRSKAVHGKLPGDAAQRFLNNAAQFGRVLRVRAWGSGSELVVIGDAQLHMRMTALLIKLRNIDRLIMRPTPLCVHEEGWLERRVSSFACCWRRAFPTDATVTPKMHMLAIDVPRFVGRHHTVCAAAQQRSTANARARCADWYDERAVIGAAASDI